MKRKVGAANTVKDEVWSHVLKSAAHTLAIQPTIDEVKRRSDNSSKQQKAAKKGLQ